MAFSNILSLSSSLLPFHSIVVPYSNLLPFKVGFFPSFSSFPPSSLLSASSLKHYLSFTLPLPSFLPSFLHMLYQRFKYTQMKKVNSMTKGGDRQVFCMRDRNRWRKTEWETDGDNEGYFVIIYKEHSRPIRASELKGIDRIDTGIQSDIPALPVLIPFSRTRTDQSEPLMTRNYTFNDQWVMVLFHPENTFTRHTWYGLMCHH